MDRMAEAGLSGTGKGIRGGISSDLFYRLSRREAEIRCLAGLCETVDCDGDCDRLRRGEAQGDVLREM